jgi:hypothetical protein
VNPACAACSSVKNGDDGAAGFRGCGTVAQPGVGIGISVRREFRSMGCYEISTEDGRPLVAQFSYATREFFFSCVPLPLSPLFFTSFVLLSCCTYLMVFWRVFHDDCWGLGHAPVNMKLFI